jgi:predicted dehydrogenase
MTQSGDRETGTALVGTGYAIRVAAPIYRAHRAFRLAAIVGRDDDRTRTRLRSAELPTELATSLTDVARRDDIGLIHIASPNECHEGHIRQLVDHPGALLLEKPLSLHEQRQQELGAVLRERLGPTFVNLPLRAMNGPDLASSEGGDWSVVVAMASPFDRRYEGVRTWKTDEALGGGVHHILLPHLCDYVLQLARDMRGRIKEIDVVLQTNRSLDSEQLSVELCSPDSEPVSYSTANHVADGSDTFATLFEASVDSLDAAIAGHREHGARPATATSRSAVPAGVDDLLAAYRMIRLLEEHPNGGGDCRRWHLGLDELDEMYSWMDDAPSAGVLHLQILGGNHD